MQFGPIIPKSYSINSYEIHFQEFNDAFEHDEVNIYNRFPLMNNFDNEKYEKYDNKNSMKILQDLVTNSKKRKRQNMIQINIQL